MLERKRLTGPLFDESQLPLWVATRDGPLPISPAASRGRSDAATKLKAWDGGGSVQIPSLNGRTDAYEEAVIQFMAFEFLRGAPDPDMLKRAAAAHGLEGQYAIAETFAKAVLAQGWDAAIAGCEGALQTTSRADAVRTIRTGAVATKVGG